MQGENIVLVSSPTYTSSGGDQDNIEPIARYNGRKFPLSIKKVAIFLVIVILIMGIIGTYYFISIPNSAPVSNSYVLPSSYYRAYPDIIQYKGKHLEAYAYFFCGNAVPLERDFYWESLLISIVQLIRIGEKEVRDIIILVCELVPDWRMDILTKLGTIVIPVKLIDTGRFIPVGNWKYNFTKLLIWRLLGWERILYLDSDLLCSDRLIELWDDPATKLVSEPPAGVDLDKIYYGEKLSSLYPYISAFAYDTWFPFESLRDGLLNAGLSVNKPSIPHFNILMNISLDYSIDLPAAEQHAINRAYNMTGPVPWKNFSDLYNATPYAYGMRDDIICYHGKFWNRNGTGSYSEEHHEEWVKRNNEMKAVIYNISILPEFPLGCSEATNSLTLEGLKLSNDTGVLYYMATQDFNYFPTYEGIKQNHIQSNHANTSISQYLQTKLTIDSLSPDTKYRIFYYAETSVKYNPLTNIYYIRCSTK